MLPPQALASAYCNVHTLKMFSMQGNLQLVWNTTSAVLPSSSCEKFPSFKDTTCTQEYRSIADSTRNNTQTRMGALKIITIDQKTAVLNINLHVNLNRVRLKSNSILQFNGPWQAGLKYLTRSVLCMPKYLLDGKG